MKSKWRKRNSAIRERQRAVNDANKALDKLMVRFLDEIENGANPEGAHIVALFDKLDREWKNYCSKKLNKNCYGMFSEEANKAIDRITDHIKEKAQGLPTPVPLETQQADQGGERPGPEVQTEGSPERVRESA